MLNFRSKISNGFFDELQAVAPHHFDPVTTRNLAGLSALSERAANGVLQRSSTRSRHVASVVQNWPGAPINLWEDPRGLWAASVAAELQAVGATRTPDGLARFSDGRRAVDRMRRYFAQADIAAVGAKGPDLAQDYGANEMLEKVAKGIVEAFESFGSDLSEIRTLARGHTLSSWREERIIKAAALAAPSAIGGPLALAYLPAEVAALMRFTYNGVLGVGFIQNGAAWSDDFANTFYVVSSDDVEFNEALRKQLVVKTQAMGVGAAAVAVSTPAGAKLLSLALINLLSIKSAGKIAAPAVTQMSAKLAAWLAGPTLAKWIPLVGAVVSGAVNGYITNEMINGADRYYRFLRMAAKDI